MPNYLLPDDPIPVVESDPFADHPPGATATVIGLALLPLGIPVLWLIGPDLVGREPIFSIALPLAVAAAACGLAVGAAVTADWSNATRAKAVLALVLLGYGVSAFCYFLQKDWLEAVRKNAGRQNREWREFQPPDRAYTVRLPGKATPLAESPVPGWPLSTFQHFDQRRSSDVFVVAHGPQPEAAAKLSEDDWFAAVRKAVAESAGAADPAEKAVTQQGYPAREFALTLPDRATNRTVRVVRVGKRVVYLAVDGAALPADAKDVKKFFDSLYITSK
jgi:hypothetical protein